MRFIQLELFTVVELSWMRDPRRRRNHSAEGEAFRREHQVRRAFGKALHQAARLRRANPSARTPDGKVSWIEAARAAFREAHKKRAQATAERDRDRKRATGELFDWKSFTHRWHEKYAPHHPKCATATPSAT